MAREGDGGDEKSRNMLTQSAPPLLADFTSTFSPHLSGQYLSTPPKQPIKPSIVLKGHPPALPFKRGTSGSLMGEIFFSCVL